MDTRLGRHGIRLLDGETLHAILDLKRGTGAEARNFRHGFVLTSERLIYLSRGGSNVRGALAAGLHDVLSIEIEHHRKQWEWVVLGALVLVGGLAMTAVGEFFVVYGGLAAAFGALIGLWALFTGHTIVQAQMGRKEISANLRSRALGDAEEFIASVFEVKRRLYRPMPHSQPTE